MRDLAFDKRSSRSVMRCQRNEEIIAAMDELRKHFNQSVISRKASWTSSIG